MLLNVYHVSDNNVLLVFYFTKCTIFYISVKTKSSKVVKFLEHIQLVYYLVIFNFIKKKKIYVIDLKFSYRR